MGITRTDDLARRLKWTYLGPAPYRWPTATIPMWATFAALFVVCGFFIAALMLTAMAPPNAGGAFLIVLLALVIAAFAAWQVTKVIFRHVDTDRTLRYWIRTFIGEVRAPRSTGHDDTDRELTIPRTLWKDDTP